jgi:hypothetical protein
MPFQLSPGVAVVEKDFTSIVPAVSTSIGGFAGKFGWGPVLEPVTIGSENELVSSFGAPTDNNFKSFFTAANFLSYTNNQQLMCLKIMCQIWKVTLALILIFLILVILNLN